MISQTTTFTETNLISDGSVPAENTDANLINPWGVSFGPGGPFWISDNNSGFVTVAKPTGVPEAIAGNPTPEITIAPPAGQTFAAAPTGTVFNGAGSGFDVTQNGKTGSAVFLFATEDGTISGWSPSVNPAATVLAVDNSQGGNGAVYKGLAIGTTGGNTFLYAANFRSGQVEMYNSAFQLVNSFTDPNLPAGYAPFDVQVLNGNLYVTYALQDAAKHDDVAGPGNGFVDEFSLNGTLMQRVASNGALNSPWGLAIAPAGFGQFAGDLLVGNFGNGTINAFNPTNNQFVGTLTNASGQPISIGDLWALTPGSGGTAGSDPNAIYFSAGVSNEAHGLFGELTENNVITTSAGSNFVPLGSGTNLMVSGGTDTISGTTGADTVAAGNNAVLLFGNGDQLLFIGGAGTASVVAGSGVSSVFGGSGTLLAFGGAGGGELAAGNGMATLVAGAGNSTLFAGTGNDVLFGGTGAATLVGGASGDDTLVAGSGAQILYGGGGTDILFAGSGATTLVGGAGETVFVAGINSAMVAGPGADFFVFASGVASGQEVVSGLSSNDGIVLQGFGADAAQMAIAGQVNSGGNTTITLSQGTTVTFFGLAHLDASAFV
jgi:uncharacterized protein (TIGR03118 family)